MVGRPKRTAGHLGGGPRASPGPGPFADVVLFTSTSPLNVQRLTSNVQRPTSSPRPHSTRIAITGSTFVARIAGMIVARSPAAASASGAPIQVMRSARLTP